MAGISRSATIILAYLIKKYGYSVDMVLSLMKRKRPIVRNL
jgi:protein-tyrosine phosphatase